MPAWHVRPEAAPALCQQHPGGWLAGLPFTRGERHPAAGRGGGRRAAAPAEGGLEPDRPARSNFAGPRRRGASHTPAAPSASARAAGQSEPMWRAGGWPGGLPSWLLRKLSRARQEVLGSLVGRQGGGASSPPGVEWRPRPSPLVCVCGVFSQRLPKVFFWGVGFVEL